MVILGWLAKYQPCVFGRVAAKADRIFISIINDELLRADVSVIQEKIRLDKLSWKQWSLTADGKHAFLLVVLSPMIHYAAPNAALKALARRLADLLAPHPEVDPIANDLRCEWLYLKNPNTGVHHKFKVILDYFASAGDGRWWHDHRFPGGFAFSLNSLGHMMRTQEWYEANSNPSEWATRLAMITIANAFDHPVHRRATSLLNLKNGSSRVAVGCPFRDQEKVPELIRGKDWTTYSGFHHTDHAVRDEFFDGADAPDRSRGAYFLDFAYIHNTGDSEHEELIRGVPIGEVELYSNLGDPRTWRLAPAEKIPDVVIPKQAETPTGMTPGEYADRPEDDEAQIQKVLKLASEWLLS